VPDLSADDRFEEIKRLLDSTISEFQSLFQSAGGFEDSRVGNGWDPDRISPDICYLKPKPLGELVKIAEGRKRSLFRHKVFAFLRPPEQEVRMLEEPKLKLIPFWMIKGFHECFYFRGNSYTILLPDDVVAVEVEGRIRDLVGQEPREIVRLTTLPRRLLGRRDESAAKSIRLNDVTELAYMYREGSIFLDADGKEDLEAEAFFEGKVSLQKIPQNELPNHFPNAEVAATAMSKEELVRRLHAMIVKPPTAFSKILSNRFQITELVEYLVPVYSFAFEWRGQRRGVTMQGFTGGIFQ
jgi:hypothetical protein